MSDAELAERVKRACIRAAEAAYEDAGIQGLCTEGRWEAAIGAIEQLDLRELEPAPADGGRVRTSAPTPSE
ncbi:MAG TPA: hypothetical protein VFI91_02380 [Longimicrobiaceae bacterium]|nr:hypothetical protein [Longimicrobiaceae bacterium]